MQVSHLQKVRMKTFEGASPCCVPSVLAGMRLGLLQGLLSGRQAFFGAKTLVPCRQNARFVVRAEGEEKSENKPKEERKGGAVAKVHMH